MAQAIKIKLLNEVVAVVFVDDLDIDLNRLRQQMDEEVEELLPRSYKFVSKWGAPVSNVQERKLSVVHLLDNDRILTIKGISGSSYASVNVLCPDNNDSTDCENVSSPKLDQIEVSASQEQMPQSCSVKLENEDTYTPMKKRRVQTVQIQTTLTGYFGASSVPSGDRFANAATRKGVHIYSEKEIASSIGYEKERRLFWNHKAEELCRESKYKSCSPNEIDKLLHECWRIQKADLLKREHDETCEKLEHILTKYPKLVDLTGSKGRKVKSETLEKNLIRVEQAKVKLQESRMALDELQVNFEEHRTEDYKKTIAAKQHLHQLYYRELSKAEDALRQTLDIRKSSLKDIMS